MKQSYTFVCNSSYYSRTTEVWSIMCLYNSMKWLYNSSPPPAFDTCSNLSCSSHPAYILIKHTLFYDMPIINTKGRFINIKKSRSVFKSILNLSLDRFYILPEEKKRDFSNAEICPDYSLLTSFNISKDIKIKVYGTSRLLKLNAINDHTQLYLKEDSKKLFQPPF